MILTKDNYHSLENTAISNSKIGDFLLSKRYYKVKHVDRSLIEKKTDAMTLGSIVDMIFSKEDPSTKFRMKVGRGDKDGRDDGRTAVTETLWNKAMEMGMTLISASFYGFYSAPDNKTQFQTPLLGKLKKGKREVMVCGMPDALTFTKGGKKKKSDLVIYDDDLKTAALGVMRTPASWYWHCHEFGYFRQFAMRRFILSRLFKGATIVQRHIVISSTKRGVHEMKLFVIPPKLLVGADKVWRKAAFAIDAEKEWKDLALEWKDAITLAVPNERTIFTNQEE